MNSKRKKPTPAEKGSPVKGIDARMLRRYLDTRKTIAKKADRIVAVAHLLNLMKNCPDDTVPVSPSALANCAGLIESELCSILEYLDDFIFPTDAEEAIET
jgi:hypothetical protein